MTYAPSQYADAAGLVQWQALGDKMMKTVAVVLMMLLLGACSAMPLPMCPEIKLTFCPV